MSKSDTELIAKLNLDESQSANLVRNAKFCEALREIAEQISTAEIDKRKGNVLANFVGQSHWMAAEPRKLVAKYIIDGRLPTATHVKEACAWAKENIGVGLSAEKIAEFEQRSGVGVCFSAEQIEAAVANFIAENLLEVKTRPNHPPTLNKLNCQLKFAAPAEVIAAYKAQTAALSPAKAESEETPKEKRCEAKQIDAREEAREAGRRFKLEKLLARDLGESLNPADVLAAHRARTGGAVVTRFPPEPNGYLHIGHAKSMRFNFKVASDHGGRTYLRYDDTNPEAESQEYIDMIRENLGWLGHTPTAVTFASDNFQRIHDVAVELVARGKAFVCRLSKEENKRLREAKLPSPYRDTPPADNLREFTKMTDGCYAEGEAVLRAKIDPTHPNPTMRDPTIYRIKYVPHPHAGNRWCVYPLYDFVHSLCDSFEDITHSLCTLEFENRRELYYWSLNELNMYRPFVWEFSRLNVDFAVVSKRKLLRLIECGIVAGWDDPRLLTLAGMRRRGYPPEAINEFCDQISVTRRGNDCSIDISVLEGVIRDYLYESVPRAFAVADPIKVELSNLPANCEISNAGLACALRLTANIFIDRADVRTADSKAFYGLAPGKVVRLRHGPFIRAEDVSEDADGRIAVRARVVSDAEVGDARAVRGILHWLPAEDTTIATLRLFDKLFLAPNPGTRTGDMLDDVNPASLVVCGEARVSADWANGLKVGDRVQFERLGFFCLDELSDVEKRRFVFNRIVGLKEKEKTKALSS